MGGGRRRIRVDYSKSREKSRQQRGLKRIKKRRGFVLINLWQKKTLEKKEMAKVSEKRQKEQERK